MKRQLAWMALVCGLVGLPFSVAHAQSGLASQGCGSLENAYGPYDYRTDKDKLGVVEKFHFGLQQESLTAVDGLGVTWITRCVPSRIIIVRSWR